MRPARRLLGALGEAWTRVQDHPFPRRLAAGVAPERLRRWLGLEGRFAEQMVAVIAPIVPRAPKTHRYVLAEALLFLVEEADWLETQGRGEVALGPVSEDLRRLVFRPPAEWELVAIEVWLGGLAYYEALRPHRPEEETARAYWERRTSAIVGAFLHDFEELADLALARAPGELAALKARQVLAGLARFWDLAVRVLAD